MGADVLRMFCANLLNKRNMKVVLIEGKKVWQVSKWWDKTVYCLGWLYAAFFALGFLKGFWGAL